MINKHIWQYLKYHTMCTFITNNNIIYLNISLISRNISINILIYYNN